jgi:hypothetical protein
LAGSDLHVAKSHVWNECGEHPVTAKESKFPKIAWGAGLLFAIGGALFLLGARRLILAHHIDFADALYCCLAILPAGLTLLVFDYVLHHAKLVSIMVLIMAGILAFSFPVFDVALGLTLMGVIGGSIRSDWKDENRPRKSPVPRDRENEAPQ